MTRLWILFPFGAVRISTVVAFAATLLVLTWYRRSLVLAAAAAMGWVCAFEIVFQFVAVVEGQLTVLHLFYLVFSLSGWVLAAHLAGVRPHPLLLLAWALLFAGWMAYGFHPNNYDQPGVFSIGDEVFNVLTKDGLAAIYIAGGIAPFRLHPASAVPAPSSAPNP